MKFKLIKLESAVDVFVLFIIIVKVIFLLAAVGHAILHFFVKTSDKAAKVDPKLVYWKERTEFVFKASMSILLIYHFHPRYGHPINSETALLFFLFGWVLLLTADWDLFIETAPWHWFSANNNDTAHTAVAEGTPGSNGNALQSSKFGIWVP